jgi:hypothetical protein
MIGRHFFQCCHFSDIPFRGYCRTLFALHICSPGNMPATSIFKNYKSILEFFEDSDKLNIWGTCLNPPKDGENFTFRDLCFHLLMPSPWHPIFKNISFLEVHTFWKILKSVMTLAATVARNTLGHLLLWKQKITKNGENNSFSNPRFCGKKKQQKNKKPPQYNGWYQPWAQILKFLTTQNLYAVIDSFSIYMCIYINDKKE